MGQTVKCMHCHTTTSIVYQTIKSKSSGVDIFLDNTPMYYCPQCNDCLISLEAIEAFNFIKTLPLNHKETNTFDYNSIKDKL